MFFERACHTRIVSQITDLFKISFQTPFFPSKTVIASFCGVSDNTRISPKLAPKVNQSIKICLLITSLADTCSVENKTSKVNYMDLTKYQN